MTSSTWNFSGGAPCGRLFSRKSVIVFSRFSFTWSVVNLLLQAVIASKRQAIIRTFCFMIMKIIKIPAIGVLALIMCMGCGHPARNAEGEAIADSSIEHGRALAATYCGSCHLLPDPDLLNKVSWEKGVLPAMGPRLGIFEFGHRHYPSYAFDPNVGFGFYPSKPLLTDWQWKEVIDYYSGLAPDSMPPQPKHEAIEVIGNGPAIFQAVAPPAGRKNPVTCYVHVDTSGGRKQIVTAGMFPGTIMRYDAQLRQLDSTPVTGGIVDVQYMRHTKMACNTGKINPKHL